MTFTLIIDISNVIRKVPPLLDIEYGRQDCIRIVEDKRETKRIKEGWKEGAVVRVENSVFNRFTWKLVHGLLSPACIYLFEVLLHFMLILDVIDTCDCLLLFPPGK